MLSFCQNDAPIRGSFWQKDSFVSVILFALCLFSYLVHSQIFPISLYLEDWEIQGVKILLNGYWQSSLDWSTPTVESWPQWEKKSKNRLSMQDLTVSFIKKSWHWNSNPASNNCNLLYCDCYYLSAVQWSLPLSNFIHL